jgi:hypothetical protein
MSIRRFTLVNNKLFFDFYQDQDKYRLVVTSQILGDINKEQYFDVINTSESSAIAKIDLIIIDIKAYFMRNPKNHLENSIKTIKKIIKKNTRKSFFKRFFKRN